MAASSSAQISSISSRSATLAMSITSLSCSARPSFPHHRFKTFSNVSASMSSKDNCRVMPSLKFQDIILWSTGLAILRRKLLMCAVQIKVVSLWHLQFHFSKHFILAFPAFGPNVPGWLLCKSTTYRHKVIETNSNDSIATGHRWPGSSVTHWQVTTTRKYIMIRL